MTGYGRATGTFGGETLSVEISSVNHRFFEATIKLPPAWGLMEGRLRDVLKERISRGKVFCGVRRERAAGAKPTLRCDLELAQQYIRASRELVGTLSSTEHVSLATLMNMDGIFSQDEAEPDLEEVSEALMGIAAAASEQLEGMRRTEGLALAADLRARFDAMQVALAEVEKRVPDLNQDYEKRLRDRVAELAVDTKVTEERLALEVALLAEKTDVNEEIVRIKAHVGHATQLLEQPEPVGRELGFLSQELQREINTLGSKLRDLGVTREVIKMKGELEKVREQMNNVE